MSFWSELKRRRVVNVAVAYLIVGLGVGEGAQIFLPGVGAPSWVPSVILVLIVLAFPGALVLAWAYDVTSEGVKRDAGPPRTSGAAPTPTTTVESPPTRYKATSSDPPAEESITVLPFVDMSPEVLPNSVAVLPLENLSPNPDDAYFAAGVHEEILNQLTKIRDLSVIARTSVKQYANTTLPIRVIARELGVGTVMEGSVRYAGERVRVTVQLIDAATENHLWSEIYERDLADVFAIQADVATKIAQALEAELSESERNSVEKPPTDSPEAYALYLRTLAVIQGGWVGASPGPRLSMQSSLDQAIALDPEFALAYVARASVSVSQLNQDPGVYEDSASRRLELEGLALRDVQQALAIDPGIGAAHGILARIHQFNWRGSEARKAYRRALELSPNEPVVLADFAVFSAMTGRIEEALELAKQAIRLDPTSEAGHTWLGFVYIIRGDADSALVAIRRAVDLSPTLGNLVILAADLEAARGNEAEALRQTRLAEQLLHDTTNPVFTAHLASIYARLGRRTDVERIFHRLEELAETRRVPSAAWITVSLALGDEERALHWLNAAADNPESYVGHFQLNLIRINAFGDPILDEPGFRAVRERLGFQD